MRFDLTNVDDQGYTILPPDRYAVVTTDDWWLRRKEENDNVIIDVDVEITAGKYKGETTRYFHTITNTEQTLGFLLRFLRSIGVIRDGDRDAKGSLVVEFVYGDKDERGRVKIKAISVNGDERAVAGYKAIAVLTEYKDNAGEKRSSISRFEAVAEDTPDSGGAPVGGQSGKPGVVFPF